jgi:hypothetical protein
MIMHDYTEAPIGNCKQAASGKRQAASGMRHAQAARGQRPVCMRTTANVVDNGEGLKFSRMYYKSAETCVPVAPRCWPCMILVGLRLLSPAPPRVQLTIELYPTIPVKLSSIYPGCRSVQDTHSHRLKHVHALPSPINLPVVALQLMNLNRYIRSCTSKN